MRSLVRAFASRLNIFMTAVLLTEANLEFLSLKGGCTGLPESTLVKMPHCWKSHVAAQMIIAPGHEIWVPIVHERESPINAHAGGSMGLEV